MKDPREGYKFTILGSGSSGGVPRIGGHWGACDPHNPRNRRRRCSLLVERDGTTVLIDTSPDMREQLLDAEVSWLDGVLISHDHADQIHGIDDLRMVVMNRMKRVDVHVADFTWPTVEQRFGYCFEQVGSYPAILNRKVMPSMLEQFSIEGDGEPVEVLPFKQFHGDVDSVGFLMGGVAYCSDVVDFPPESLELLRGIDVWIIDCLRYKPHPTHSTFDQVMGWINDLKPKQAVLTNMHIDIDYETIKNEVPNNVVPAYDGMTITYKDGHYVISQ